MDFPPLLEELRGLLPPGSWLPRKKAPHSRQRIFSLRLTFECFVLANAQTQDCLP